MKTFTVTINMWSNYKKQFTAESIADARVQANQDEWSSETGWGDAIRTGEDITWVQETLPNVVDSSHAKR